MVGGKRFDKKLEQKVCFLVLPAKWKRVKENARKAEGGGLRFLRLQATSLPPQPRVSLLGGSWWACSRLRRELGSRIGARLKTG